MIFTLISLCFGAPRLSYESELESNAMVQIQVFLEQGNHEEVRKILDRFEEKLFPSAQLYYEVGLVYNQQGKITLAREYYDKALEINPKHLSALYDRAELYILEGNTSEAKRDLQLLLDKGHEHWAIYFRLAEIAAKEKDGKKMEDYLLKAIKKDLDLTLLLKDPMTWKKAAKDPKLGSYLHRIFVVMAEEKLWKALINKE